MVWLSAQAFANGANVVPRVARRIISSAYQTGKSWKGANLSVRVISSRGGKSGHSYEVALSSLPEPIQARLRGDFEPANGTEHNLPQLTRALPILPDRQQSRRQAKAAAVAWVERHADGTPERRAAMEEAADKFGIPTRTLYRLLETHRQRGIAAFQHAAKGREKGPQVAVTRAFDKAFLKAGGKEEELSKLRTFIDERLRAEWAGKPGRAGWRFVAREVSTSLHRLMPELLGRRPPISAKLFTLTRARADTPDLRALRQIDIQKNDAKRFDDTSPRIMRDHSLLGIMEEVVCDVKPFDVPVLRPDGTEAWPRLIGFMDSGTQRLFYRVCLCPKGEGIRQEHVIEAFLDMVSHPDWGFPRKLYRDNGSEFAAFDMIAAAMEQITLPGQRGIVSAMAYNASAKPIESFFGTRLDPYVASQMDGWAGGDRMKSKIKYVGKQPEPYPHSFEVFCGELELRISDIMNMPMQGGLRQWQGKTPNELFAEKREATAWRPITVNQLDIDMLFCKRETRQISKGVIRFGSTRWRHPELPARGECDVIVPWRRNADPIFIIPGVGPAYLSPDLAYHPSDSEGAKESARRKAKDKRQVRAMTANIGPSHAPENLRYRNQAIAPAIPDRKAADIDVGSAVSELADFKRQAIERRKEEKNERALEVARRHKITQRLGGSRV